MIEALGREATIRECYGPAMEITEQAKADAYFEMLVTRGMKYFGRSREDTEAVERSNLGYYAGYYGHETMARTQALYSCKHPVFGGV